MRVRPWFALLLGTMEASGGVKCWYVRGLSHSPSHHRVAFYSQMCLFDWACKWNLKWKDLPVTTTKRWRDQVDEIGGQQRQVLGLGGQLAWREPENLFLAYRLFSWIESSYTISMSAADFFRFHRFHGGFPAARRAGFHVSKRGQFLNWFMVLLTWETRARGGVNHLKKKTLTSRVKRTLQILFRQLKFVIRAMVTES
jgi:hypothetical protein